MNRRRNSGLLDKLKRSVRYRLHIPMMRNTQPPEYVARGVMVGMIWAMTPFFGIHMGLVFFTWLLTRKLFGWDFSLVNGLAWTWTTNVLTVLPAFYLFYLTGQFLTGHFSDPLGYDSFKSIFQVASQDSASDLTHLGDRLKELWNAFGVPLFAGSAFWAAVSGWLAYRMSLNFVVRYRQLREKRMSSARQRSRNAA